MGRNEATLPTHPARSETKKGTDKEPTRNRQVTDATQSGTRTLTMLRTKQLLFVGLLGLLLGLLLLSAQVRAGDDDEKFCCRENTAVCQACLDDKSVRKFCKKDKNRDVPGCPFAGCCRVFDAACLACEDDKSVRKYCKKDKNRDIPGCEKFYVGFTPSPCCLSGHCNENACNGLSFEEGGRGDFSAKCISCDLGISVEEFCRTKQPEGKTMEGCEKYSNCCQAIEAKCESCKQGLSEKEYCEKSPSTSGCEKYNCCRANNIKCLSCAEGISEEEYCKKNPSFGGCEKYRNCCQAVEAKCEACKQGISEEEFCKKAPSTFFGPVQGCEKYNCCRANNIKCLSCAEGISEEEYCRKNPTFGGCEQYNCCQAVEAKCEAGKQGISEEQYCRKNPQNFLGTPGCEKYTTPPDNNCCQAVEARCEACKEGISEEEYCNRDPFLQVAPMASGL